MARILKTNLTTELLLNPTFRQLETIVGGELHEQEISDAPNSILLVPKEGLAIGLPINEVATAIIGYEIYGDVVICDLKELDSETLTELEK